MSESSFDDDDEELMALIRATQAPAAIANLGPHPTGNSANPTNSGNPESSGITGNTMNGNNSGQILPNMSGDLIRAQGEISILRAQLESLQSLKNEEIRRLNREYENAQSLAQSHISALKQLVDKLEDEKKFLGNEIRSLSAAKRRKVATPSGLIVEVDTDRHDDIEVSGPEPEVLKPLKAISGPIKQKIQPIISIQDDWSLFCLHIWNYTINGSSRSSVEILSRICTDRDVHISPELQIDAWTPILAAIWNYLMLKKDLRLDKLVRQFSEQMVMLIKSQISENKNRRSIVAVPFITSLLHACVNFKVSAVDEHLVVYLVQEMCGILAKFVFLLQLEDEEESFLDHHNVTYQHRLLENFTLVLCFDILEDAVSIATQFGPKFVSRIWENTIDTQLLLKILPENSERFKSVAQINLVYNYVEMLSASLSSGGFAANKDHFNKLLVASLIKVFLIDISIKEDFMFFGLNRALGNNEDFERISASIPTKADSIFSHSLIATALPVNPPKSEELQGYHVVTKHQFHLLSLRIRIVNTLESLVISGSMHLLNEKENLKSIVRIIAFEQNAMMHQPRSQFIHMRLTIVAVLVRILYYITDEHKNINTLIYPETLYEIFVILMRVAFGSDSLSLGALKLLSEIRARGFTDVGVFNRWCEQRSRDISHINLHEASGGKFGMLSDAECNFGNGLEFPYELETIEIAREILGVCVNHDEADNLYYNMNEV
ncbi:CIC11C00000005390 [Sungouiella intermedia]|uniref:CIC11C00000005390 n=1 Tax=Sungouiella intermedia TaxID=45354 RepID=A0A1L0DEI8_9ASCO|nr:CIC11C00000005390 [[Candida] intermedia]